MRDVTLSEKNAENDVPKDPFITGHSLVTHSQGKKSLKSKPRPGNCDYCEKKKLVFSRFNVIINAETMKNLSKNQGRCFDCLSKKLVSKTYKANYSSVERKSC